MSKTKEELNALKEEMETLTTKLKELTDDELKEITGGAISINPQSNIIKVYDENTGKEYGYFPNTEDGIKRAIELAHKLGLSIVINK